MNLSHIKAEIRQEIFPRGLKLSLLLVGLGGLGLACSPRDPRFAGSNPAEVDGFFQDVKILSTSPPKLKFQAR